MAKKKKEEVAAEETAALVKWEGQYPALASDSKVYQALAKNMRAGVSLSPLDLDVIKIGAGGVCVFTVVTRGGEETIVPGELRMIVLCQKLTRLYWEKPLGDGQTVPPDCQSDDAVMGTGNPGGMCARCHKNRFAPKNPATGKWGAKPCKEVLQVFGLLPGAVLPARLRLPPTSIRGWDSYTLALSTKPPIRSFTELVTVFKLEKATNNTGIDYARVVVSRGEDVPEENQAAVEAARETFTLIIQHVVPTGEDYYQKSGHPGGDRPEGQPDPTDELRKEFEKKAEGDAPW